jgi:TIR domain
MLPSEKLEFAIYKAVNKGPGPVNYGISISMLSRLTGENDQAAIVDHLRSLEAENRIFLTKYLRGSPRPRPEFENDSGFFYNDSFLIEIAPQGRKYFEELEQRAEQEEKSLPSREQPMSNTQLVPPRKAVEILTKQINNAAYLSGEPFGSPKREEWTGTSKGALARAFAAGSPILNSFRAAQSISFNANSTDEELRRVANNNLLTQIAVLRSAVEQLGWDLEGEGPVAKPVTVLKPTVLIFISHSSKDVALASALIELLRAGLTLKAEDIRCSSVDGYRLPGGANTEEQLRQEVNTAKAFIGLITKESLASPYVMFELGARWGAGLHMLPLLAGVDPSYVKGPLAGINALSCASEAQIHQLLADIAKELSVSVGPAAAYVAYVKKLVDLCR